MGFGDELMASYEARLLKERHPEAQVLVLPPVGEDSWCAQQREVFRNNPYITPPEDVDPDREIVVLDNRPGSRPYIADWTNEGIRFTDYRCGPGDLFFDEQELHCIARYRERFGDCLLFEPSVKKSLTARNKDWNFGAERPGRWVELFQRLKDRYTILQMGRIENMDNDKLLDTIHIRTRGFRDACCLLAAVRGVVCCEGGVHHAAGALRKPAVVIFGGRTSPATTGYEFHRNLYVDAPGSPCGRFVDCRHCGECMARITVDRVEESVLGLWPPAE